MARTESVMGKRFSSNAVFDHCHRPGVAFEVQEGPPRRLAIGHDVVDKEPIIESRDSRIRGSQRVTNIAARSNDGGNAGGFGNRRGKSCVSGKNVWTAWMPLLRRNLRNCQACRAAWTDSKWPTPSRSVGTSGGSSCRLESLVPSRRHK